MDVVPQLDGWLRNGVFVAQNANGRGTEEKESGCLRFEAEPSYPSTRKMWPCATSSASAFMPATGQ